MKKHFEILTGSLLLLAVFSCSKSGDDDPVTPVLPAKPLTLNSVYFNNTLVGSFTATSRGIVPSAAIRLRFDNKVSRTSVPASLSVYENGSLPVGLNVSYENSDSTIVLTGSPALKYLTKYNLIASINLQSVDGGKLTSAASISFNTGIDSSRKFPALTDDALLTKVQQQTFKYFWDFAHPVSGLARERNTSGDICTSGGTGFGIMAIPVGISRNFITRADGLQRMQKIVAFLKNTAVKVKGAFPHWINGASGAIIPFSATDDGADLVETSYLMMGLLTARQYFNGADPAETTLRSDINTLYDNVEWDWFRNGGQQVLYWHYSNTNGWTINLPIRGWNECLITYVVAAASTTHGIPASVYNNGWKGGGQFLNGNSYFGYPLPLGPAQGGPLFFSHYSFLGINPNSLTDVSASYTTQTKNHTLINYSYCKGNPRSYFGYSDSVWGLTASDIENGYTASSPTNDLGFIAPTAALSSMPFTPSESMAALKFYYYVLGDKLWKEYGFVDAFSLHNLWFADSFLAIDQGPVLLMIENYRTGLLWNLFTSCPEIKTGMQSLGFSASYL